MTYKIDGFAFENSMEADRYLVLKHMKATGLIKNFKVHPKIVLVQPYRRCLYCDTLSTETMCELCNSQTYSSNGIRFPITFLVTENNERKIFEKVMEAPLSLSHEFHMKKILYDQICSLPFRIVVNNIRYLKTARGWRKEYACI